MKSLASHLALVQFHLHNGLMGFAALLQVKFWNFCVANVAVKEAKTYEDFFKAAEAMEANFLVGAWG